MIVIQIDPHKFKQNIQNQNVQFVTLDILNSIFSKALLDNGSDNRMKLFLEILKEMQITIYG